jgi:two-component system, cell cycle sensor histidine kinase and response regulator CckA
MLNARQAMPDGGTIELTARNVVVGKNEHPTMENGNYVKISVKDHGSGMQKEHIAKIFDPFFTTKAQGNGLGLAICHSVVNRHGGSIEVDSEPGKGSTFHIYLPASAQTVSPPKEKKTVARDVRGTFLLMDDEEIMRETIQHMLEALGYGVICKENGRDAVDFFIAETMAHRAFAGLIFDLTVPGGMGGKTAVREVRKLDSKIAVFVTSGYADDPIMKNPGAYGFTASISKPFRKSELAELLNKHLGTPRTRGTTYEYRK